MQDFSAQPLSTIIYAINNTVIINNKYKNWNSGASYLKDDETIL